jgi:hypothetical protein
MKRIIYNLVVAACFATAFAQQPKPPTVTDDEFQKVLVAVSNEEWEAAVALSSKLLKQMKDEDKRLVRLRYIYLYAASGMVTTGKMEFEDFAKSAKEFVGKEVECPYRPITLECRGAFNFICPSNEKQDRATVAASNKTGTSILAFEYTQLKEPFDFARHEDEAASISGTIDAIVPNPNKSRFLVMRLFITNGIINLKDKTPSVALLGVVCLFTLACSSRHVSTHKADQEMIANFQTHRADFDELLKMFRADKGLLYFSKGHTRPENVQSIGVTSERLKQYQALFARLGLDGMGDLSRPEGSKEEVWFFTSIEGPRESTFKHYAFLSQPARGVVNDLDHGASKSAPYRVIEDHWYLALDDAD